jgi:UDP-glucose:(glucosyl)LPS alpha-1,2-glucosyltransferase
MSLTIIDDTEVEALGPTDDGTYTGAKGGTEMMADRIKGLITEMGIEDKINVIHSRVRNVDTSKRNLLVLHDLFNDPEVSHLKDVDSRNRFDKLIFVSNQQMQTYNLALGVPYQSSLVMKNAIDPIMLDEAKPTDKINIIYHTTPHRGLELLVPCFEKLAETNDNIHLDVYSSFSIYGWEERDKQYQPLFDQIKAHPQMTYHGYQPNDVVREALKKAHIFGYPNIWPETSCIAVLEAMSAQCEVVCPNHAALFETTAGYAREYQFAEDRQVHANIFVNVLNQAIENIRSKNTEAKLSTAKRHIDTHHSWEVKKQEWASLFSAILQ